MERTMNETQKQLLLFAIAQSIIDSTPGLPQCCEEHKRMGWDQLQTPLFPDSLEIEKLGQVIADKACLN
jgi:hypothetical protein